MPTPPPHPCPAGCGRPVPHNQFACRADWDRLPFRLRQPISANYHRDAFAHAQAMRNARDWYRNNPTINDIPAPVPTPSPAPALPLFDVSADE